ncbi:MAG: hypothetical protein P2A85_09135 [Microcoleus anatoxicus]|uniref:hypothetical protein n=1 Tax=Microcoleus anatoxicus TaxID=2705319 RepID=UPI00366EBB12
MLGKKGIKQIQQALTNVDDKAEPELYNEVEAELHPESVQQELTIADFAKEFNSEDKDGYSALLENESIGFSATSILKKVTLGLSEWEYRFLAAYSCLPSILTKVLPVIEIHGEAGTGKSQLLLAIGHISGNNIISGQSTGASLKNHINQIRWRDPDTKYHEKNCLLLIDNMGEDSFKKEEYLSSFLNGYKRTTDRTFISNGKGQNIEFRTYCGKLYTTIWDTNSTELARRTIRIKTRKVSDLGIALEPEDIYWNPLTAAVALFWDDPESWSSYKQVWQKYSRHTKPKHSKEHWTLLRDVLVTGVVIGAWSTLDDAIAQTATWLEKALTTRTTLTEVVILRALESILGLPQADWEEISKRHIISVSPRQLKDAIEEAVKDGIIERPKLSTVQQYLTKLGFGASQKNGQLGYVYKGKK